PLTTPASTYIHPLSLHDALPICLDFLHRIVGEEGFLRRLVDVLVLGAEVAARRVGLGRADGQGCHGEGRADGGESEGGSGTHERDRKSTRLNSSHVSISYAVFCL